MRCLRLVLLLSCAALAACATPRPPAGLSMPAPDEGHAASLLAAYLLAQGWTVRLAEPTLVEATRGAERLRVEPLLDAGGLDRVLVSRAWPAAPGADPEALSDLARELDELLNVGRFRAEPEALVLQAALPFLESLDPRLLDAFIAFTAEVRFAVLQVQGERHLLAPVEGDGPGR